MYRRLWETQQLGPPARVRAAAADGNGEDGARIGAAELLDGDDAEEPDEMPARRTET
jgi:hypothetical protein